MTHPGRASSSSLSESRRSHSCSSAFTSNRKGWAAGDLEGYATSCAGRRAVTAASVLP